MRYIWQFVLERRNGRLLMRKHGIDDRIVIVDMGVPRDVEASASCLDAVFLYSVDELKQISVSAVSLMPAARVQGG